MHDRNDWIRGPDGPQTIKNRVYKNLVEFRRPCVTCNQFFSIFVTHKIANGDADSNSFGLKNCEAHRRSSTHGGDETLRMANSVMKAELDGLYARDKELFAENQILKARLATFELQGAMAAVIDDRTALGLPPRNAPGTATAAKANLTFPWS